MAKPPRNMGHPRISRARAPGGKEIAGKAGGSGRPASGRPAARDDRKSFRIAGLPAVSALFARDPDRVEKLFFDVRAQPLLEEACARMSERRRPYKLVDAEEMEKVAGTALHGGVVAWATSRPVRIFDLDEAKIWAAENAPLLLLDGVSNPHNLGAIVRTAAFFGIERVVISDHPAQALPSEAAYRVAEGGFEYVTLYRADRFAVQLKRLGAFYRVVGTALGDHRPLGRIGQGPKPAAIVLGNEEQGLSPATMASCAEVVTIPGSGWVQSLNVSATTAILAYLATANRTR